MTEEIVVVFAEPPEGAPESPSQASAAAAAEPGLVFEPIFERPSRTPQGLSALASLQTQSANDYDREIARYYRLSAPQTEAEALLARVRALDGVETAYIKPAVQNPLAPDTDLALDDTPPAPPQQIPDFRPLQGYLGPAPGGIDVKAAWNRPGGRGAGVKIIDIEGGWRFTHLDLRDNMGGLLGGSEIPGPGWRDHGTAVFGEIAGDDNPYGVTGAAPDAIISAVSHAPGGSARAIQFAASMLRPGDVLLLEMHRPGPRFGYQNRSDQRGFICVEWWPDDFLAILGAVAKGVVVVEAAGNGGEDLSDPYYDSPAPGFPASWKNPFRGACDSGAIVVGAGAPPSGLFGPDRSRLDFSNHGERVDCQGWGRGVATTGYGDMFRGADEDRWYTGSFSGTSSASPIVTGTIACLQGIARARNTIVAPAPLRQWLRTTGSPQAPSPIAPLAQRIGPRPNLAHLVAKL